MPGVSRIGRDVITCTGAGRNTRLLWILILKIIHLLPPERRRGEYCLSKTLSIALLRESLDHSAELQRPSDSLRAKELKSSPALPGLLGGEQMPIVGSKYPSCIFLHRRTKVMTRTDTAPCNPMPHRPSSPFPVDQQS